MKNDGLLIVSPIGEIIYRWLETAVIKRFDIECHIVTRATEGFKVARKMTPALIVIDDNLPDMNGMSFSAILRDMVEGAGSKIYLFNIEKLLPHTKADFYLPKMEYEELQPFLIMQIKRFFKNHYIEMVYSQELLSKRMDQLSSLPKPITENKFSISGIFSPFDQLSGDGYDYWLGDDNNGIYGFLFDCTGHGPTAYPFVANIRSALKKSFRLFQNGFFKSLPEVMHDINFDVINSSTKECLSPTAAIVFHIDFEKNKLEVCTAGIPCFYYRKKGESDFTMQMCRNFLLGMIHNATFDPLEMDLGDVEELMFTSDGFSEIFQHKNNLPKHTAKHDDVSAITVQISRN